MQMVLHRQSSRPSIAPTLSDCFLRAILSAIARLVLAAVLCFQCSTSHAEATTATEEYSIKAAFIYNFAKFVDWPSDTFSSPASPINVCVYGKNLFGSTFDLIHKKKAQGREIQVMNVAAETDFKYCQIIFIGVTDERQLTRLITSISHSPILTISDTRNFSRVGGMINLVLINNKVHFEININAARRANLRISSKLLSLATIIDEPSAEKDQ